MRKFYKRNIRARNIFKSNRHSKKMSEAVYNTIVKTTWFRNKTRTKT